MPFSQDVLYAPFSYTAVIRTPECELGSELLFALQPIIHAIQKIMHTDWWSANNIGKNTPESKPFPNYYSHSGVNFFGWCYAPENRGQSFVDPLCPRNTGIDDD